MSTTTMKNSRHRNCSACNKSDNEHGQNNQRQNSLSQSKSVSRSQSQSQSKSHMKSRYQKQEQQIRLQLSRNSIKNNRHKSIKKFKKCEGDHSHKNSTRKLIQSKEKQSREQDHTLVANTKTKSTKHFKNSLKKCLNVDYTNNCHQSQHQNTRLKLKQSQTQVEKCRLCHKCEKCQNCGQLLLRKSEKIKSRSNSRKKINKKNISNCIQDQHHEEKRKLIKYLSAHNQQQTPPLFNGYNVKQQLSPFLHSSYSPSQQGVSSNPVLLQSASPQQQHLSRMLDEYQRILNERIGNLRSKWSQLQILEKSISGRHPQGLQSHNINDSGSNYVQTLKVQNQFYVDKITHLQREIKDKDIRIQQLSANKATTSTNNSNNVNNDSKRVEDELRNQNRKIKQENALLQKQNRVLKNKLKQLGFL